MTFSTDQPGSDHQWWLSEGSEVCSVCEAFVHPEMHGYCLLCDQTMCYLCSGEPGESGSGVCPDCARESQSKEQA